MSNEIQGVPEAIKILQKALKEDPGYYQSWQSNIAMAFWDEYQQTVSATGHELVIDVKSMMNGAAKKFLDLLISQK